MKKKFISILLSMVMLFCNLNFAYASQTTSKEPPLEFADNETMQVENKGEIAEVNKECGYTVYSNGLMVIEGTGILGGFPQVVKYDSSSGETNTVYVNKVIVKEGVTGFSDGAFANLWDTPFSITLPESLTKLSDYLFSNSALKTINIPSGVKTIGKNAFLNCSNLSTVTFSGSPTSIEEYAFSNCSKLTNISLPEGITNIEDCAFSDCTSLTSISLPESLTSTGRWVFSDCTSLVKATTASNLTTISIGLFYNCKNLSSVTLSDNVEIIDDKAFYGCNLTEIDLPSNLVCIGIQAFYNCTNLKLADVNLPLNLMDIGWAAFKGCKNITDIGLSQGFYIDNIFESENLINITLLQYVTDVGDQYDGIFKNCTNLQNIFVDENNTMFESYDGVLYTKGKTMLVSIPRTRESITFPDSMTDSYYNAFENCSKIKSIVFPKVMDRIEISMDGCTSLSDLTIYPDLGFFHIDFGNCNALKIHCAKDSDAYRFTGYPTGSEIICDISSLYPEPEPEQSTAEVISSQTTEETTVSYSAKGDINKDGIISDKDATLIIKYIYGITSSIFYDLDAADANGDGIIDGLDAIWVLNNQGKTSNPASSTTDSIAEKTTKLPLEQITT